MQTMEGLGYFYPNVGLRTDQIARFQETELPLTTETEGLS